MPHSSKALGVEQGALSLGCAFSILDYKAPARAHRNPAAGVFKVIGRIGFSFFATCSDNKECQSLFKVNQKRAHFLLRTCFKEHFFHKIRIVEMAFSDEGHCMTAPLAHGAGGEDTCGPEDPSLQPLAARRYTVFTKHAFCPPFWEGKT